MSLRHDEETIQAALDQELGEEAFAAFEERLRTDKGLRQLYLSYSRADGLLAEKYGDSEPRIVPIATRAKARHKRNGTWMAVAACVAGALVAVSVIGRSTDGTTIEFGPESHGRLVHPDGKGSNQQLVSGSKIELEHGSASILMPDGSRAYFEGPGSLESVGDHDFVLHVGRVWFASSGKKAIHCRTSSLHTVAARGEFGIIAEAVDREELHVLQGELAVETTSGDEMKLLAGQSALWKGNALAATNSTMAFATSFPKSVVVFDEDFSEPDLTPLSGKKPDTGSGTWTVERGGPLVENGVLDTSGNVRHTAFAPLQGPPLNELSHILLLTLETEDPETSRFHSEGWAGVSLFTGDEERVFVGDPCGPEKGWALHPAGYSARQACPLLHGKTTVTLRYEYRTGLAQLFEGTDTTGPALASEWIAPHLQFDRIRIANGSQADAAVDAGKPASAAGDGPDVEVRGDIALRRIKVSILSSGEDSSAFQP